MSIVCGGGDFLSSPKETKGKTILVLVILLVTIGTASGVLLWISNQISTNVDPAVTPISLTGGFDTSPTMEIVSASVFTYFINDDTQDIGYIVLEFVSQGVDIGPSNFTVDIEYQPFGEILLNTQVVSGYPINRGFNAVQYVFEQSGGGAIDFGPSSTINGDLTVRITYHISLSLTVTMQLSSTSS